jgi:YVTN family beta-propeller protein
VPNFTYAQILHNQTLYGMPSMTLTQIAHMPLSGIGFDALTNTIYVANFDDISVSVINAATHAVIGKPIHVGNHP